MDEYLIKGTTLDAIGNAIRNKTNKTNKFTPLEMITEIENITTGVELNFAVIGGPTQPENPIENTIWVNTNNNISTWVFQTYEPEAPTEGMIWFLTGLSSRFSFNAIKDNNIVSIYPIWTKQYTNESWVNISTMIYQNSEWKSWSEYLYYYNKPVNYTWKAVAMSEAIAGNQQGVTPSISFSSNGSVTVKGNSGSKAYVGGIYRIVGSIDFTEISSLVADVVSGSAILSIFKKGGDAWGSNTAYGGDMVKGCGLSAGTWEYDTSSLRGEYDIGIGVIAGDVVTLNSIEIIKGN